MESPGTPRLCLFGAVPDTGNQGVSALWHSALAGILRRAPTALVTVFDHGRSVREDSFRLGDEYRTYQRCGASHSRRYYRRESLWNMRVSGWLGGLGNPGVKLIADADAVLDVTGGDSFTDLYGRKRFRAVTLNKLVTIEQGTPLILLPQTYGPFQASKSRALAQMILQSSAMAWARDARSYEILKDLLKDKFDPSRHLSGVDMAFGLERYTPRSSLPEQIDDWLGPRATRPVVGINVSGLIYNNVWATQRFSLRTGYQAAMQEIVARLLDTTEANIVLVPHVCVPSGHYESDTDACRSVSDGVATEHRDRVAVLSQDFDQSELKDIIARMSWFCSTRMHAAIAALSTGVPTSAIAYSDKTQGVFDTCGQGGCVADARAMSTEELVEHVMTSWNQREESVKSLQLSLPGIQERVSSQMDAIVAACS